MFATSQGYLTALLLYCFTAALLRSEDAAEYALYSAEY
jgi:hypothetical protein